MTASTLDYTIYAGAVKEALDGLREGGIPIGAVLARGLDILGVERNRRVQINAPTAHAEIDCIRFAGRLQTYKGTTLYATLTPCYLCSGAIVLFGVTRVVIGQTQTYDGEGSLEFLDSHGGGG